MSKPITLIYPHQLFQDHPALSKERTVYLIEDSLYFSQYKFHKQKLVLHRASMKAYEAYLLKEGYEVMYLEHDEFPQDAEIHVVDVVDDWLERKIEKSVKVVWYESPQFLTSTDEVKSYWDTHKRHLQHDFYVWQRKRLHILIEDGEPVGGKWSFDSENREKLPTDVVVPQVHTPKRNAYVEEAIVYVNKKFKDNYGDIDSFWYATTHKEAEEVLKDFLKRRFSQFGPYEDAISVDEHVVFHSVLSLYLNNGLLTPKQVLDAVFSCEVPLASLEGFVRQLIGWREYMRMVYVCDGRKMRGKNKLHATQRLTPSWWRGDTGIYPIDHTIGTLQKYAYTHHIVRLMVMGNIMTLLGVHPEDAYLWFMEWYIDAYDWVMVPNVYGMALYADGGTIVTKPYVSSSKYIKKMSNYPKGEWEECFDALYWMFVGKHRGILSKLHRSSFMVVMYDKFSDAKKRDLKEVAEGFVGRLCN
ncbi:MAG: cryptochrome/photolyase family protein [Candidatus Taylorbacteria bacterium]|nr:cryptochrome/photolyase family protein [Candidatus Taylorbacteria bacterium]